MVKMWREVPVKEPQLWVCEVFLFSAGLRVRLAVLSVLFRQYCALLALGRLRF